MNHNRKTKNILLGLKHDFNYKNQFQEGKGCMRKIVKERAQVKADFS